MGGPRNYFPRGWDCETQSADLKCDGCGGLRRHAVIRDRSSSPYFQARHNAIGAMANAECAGITVKRERLKNSDALIEQRLDTRDWTITIDSRLQPEQVAKAMEYAHGYVHTAHELRWWVELESHTRFPWRRYGFTLSSNGLPSWHSDDRDVVL
jgi:hypothetical protein